MLGDFSLVGELLPLGSDIIIVAQHLPVDVGAGFLVRLYGDVGILVGTGFHLEAILVASLQRVVVGIDKELRLPGILGVGNGMHPDATRVVIAHTIGDAGHIAIPIAVATDETRGIVALAVAVAQHLDPLGRRLFFAFWVFGRVVCRCSGQTAIGGVHQARAFGNIDFDGE